MRAAPKHIPLDPLSPDQLEAIESANAIARNSNLPTYSELALMLNRLVADVLHAPHLENDDPMRTTAHEAETLVNGAI